MVLLDYIFFMLLAIWLVGMNSVFRDHSGVGAAFSSAAGIGLGMVTLIKMGVL